LQDTPRIVNNPIRKMQSWYPSCILSCQVMAITSRKHCGAYRNSLAICRASAEACQRAAFGLAD